MAQPVWDGQFRNYGQGTATKVAGAGGMKVQQARSGYMCCESVVRVLASVSLVIYKLLSYSLCGPLCCQNVLLLPIPKSKLA